mgnify:CR=1 FL=1
MLEWLDRYMAKFAQTDHIRREEHARRQEEASPAHEEAVALLEAFPYLETGECRSGKTGINRHCGFLWGLRRKGYIKNSIPLARQTV